MASLLSSPLTDSDLPELSFAMARERRITAITAKKGICTESQKDTNSLFFRKEAGSTFQSLLIAY